MGYIYGKQDLRNLERSREISFLMTNGLGGFLSASGAFSVPRTDQGILVAAVKAPNERINMVHRLRETLKLGEREVTLSTQGFAGRTPPEEGWRYLSRFSFGDVPTWTYHVSGVRVERRCAMGWERNASCVVYEIENRTGQPCTIMVEPFFKFAPKEQALTEKRTYRYENGTVTSGAYTLYMTTDGDCRKTRARWQRLAYPEDAKDGRPSKGWCGSCCTVSKTVAPGETAALELVFSVERESPNAGEMIRSRRERMAALEASSGLWDPLARQLARAADDFIARRDSTGGKTILAGYPLFGDWGRDTMIALPGCCLSTGRYEDARSILRTFLAYEQDGLVPNLFPEGSQEPMYNTVDAALLLIDCVWQYYQRTGDREFVAEAFPVLERIVAAYQKGTHHAIGMDDDGLIFAGAGLDQVTWMDVRVNDILPTPRHGKPVEINAYWYNALRIMERLAPDQGKDGCSYAALADRVKESFVSKFYMADRGYLKDVLSGTASDEQLRCNQIWAVAMSFTMLSPEQERRVVDTVYRHLYTPCGLRTLSPEDPEYKGSYGGDQVKRDMAYHQGTAWVFPLGAFYRAWLKVNGSTPEAAGYVRRQLDALEPMLREGCAGQLPEIYDGDFPAESKGCFAQAWSVGEILRVLEEIQIIQEQ